jgi:cobyrinic acid a,c-diamide synthase
MVTGDAVVHKNERFGCLTISSPQGHSGKTTVTIGLCDLLRRKGLSIQPFKKGPDYIDPSWLTLATGRSCRNLDLFLIPKDQLIHSFQQACEGADLAVVEGAMGLYDGYDSAGQGTTAELAALLKSPVILVVNCARMTGSIAAMVSGYQHFQRGVRVAGVILNYVSGARHEQKLRSAVEQHCQIPVVGSIPRDRELRITERHLGLIPVQESKESEAMIDRLGRRLEDHLDLKKILEIAQTAAPPRPAEGSEQERVKSKSFPLPLGLPAEASVQAGEGASRLRHGASATERVRGKGGPVIGVIRDRAFNFYYPENLEALKKAGADLIFIDALADRLPRIDGLYIGGGFPEFFLKELEDNRGLRQDIAEAIEDDLAVYAECAGLMYLCRRIYGEGRPYDMVGVIPAEVRVTERPQGHGYVEADVVLGNPFFAQGTTIRGHEFHHSKLDLSDSVALAYRLKRGHGVRAGEDGIVYKNLFGSYTHIHALGTPEWAPSFVSLAGKRRMSSDRFAHRTEKNLQPLHGN